MFANSILIFAHPLFQLMVVEVPKALNTFQKLETSCESLQNFQTSSTSFKHLVEVSRCFKNPLGASNILYKSQKNLDNLYELQSCCRSLKKLYKYEEALKTPQKFQTSCRYLKLQICSRGQKKFQKPAGNLKHLVEDCKSFKYPPEASSILQTSHKVSDTLYDLQAFQKFFRSLKKLQAPSTSFKYPLEFGRSFRKQAGNLKHLVEVCKSFKDSPKASNILYKSHEPLDTSTNFKYLVKISRSFKDPQ